jgi:transposase
MPISPYPFHDNIPEDTARVARTIFDEDNVYLRIGDNLQLLLSDTNFSDLYRSNSVPAVQPELLALLLVFQLFEGLPDDQIVANSLARIDWKYALHFSLTAPGIELATFADFRQRLLSHQAGLQMFNQLIGRLLDLRMFYPG